MTLYTEAEMTPILKKISVGDGLTDAELNRARKFFTELENKLSLMGPEFFLALNPVRRKRMELDDFYHYRKYHRKYGEA